MMIPPLLHHHHHHHHQRNSSPFEEEAPPQELLEDGQSRASVGLNSYGLSSLGRDTSPQGRAHDNNNNNDDSIENAKESFCSKRNLQRWIFLWLWINGLALLAYWVLTKFVYASDNNKPNDNAAALTMTPTLAPPLQPLLLDDDDDDTTNTKNNPWLPIGVALDSQAFANATAASLVRYGYAVSMSKDGQVLAVSAPLENNKAGVPRVGSVRMYQWNSDGGANNNNNNQWSPMGQILYGTRSNGQFGLAVSLSFTGTRVAIGAPSLDRVGQVQVYDYYQAAAAGEGTGTGTGTTLRWIPAGPAVTGVGLGESFGSAVSLSADGTWLAVGAPGYDANAGTARVYKWSTNEAQNEWILQQPQQQGGGATAFFKGTPHSKLGFSLALVQVDNNDNNNNSDKVRLVVGAPFDTYNGAERAGMVQVYEYDGDNNNNNNKDWQPLGSPLRGIQSNGWFGWSVDIAAASGNYVAVGSPKDNRGGGAAGSVAVYQYKNNNDEWTLVGQEILGEDIGGWFGNTVALSANGQRVVGGHYMNGNPGGHVRVLEYSPAADKWQAVGPKILGHALFDPHGTSLSVSGDGSRVVSSARDEVSPRDSAFVQAFYFSDKE